MAQYETGNVDQLYELGLITTTDVPAEYAEIINGLDANFVGQLTEFVQQLDAASPEARLAPYGQRAWTVFMVF